MPLHGGRRIILVDRPGSVQSTLRLGHPSPHRAHPDHVPMTLAGTVLGGAFTSRLNHLLREVRGYTYGIRGDFAASRRFGRFAVSSGVQTAVTAPALVEAVGEITRTQAGGVTEDELEVARSWRAGQLSVELQSPRAIASALTTLVVHDLPDDYHAAVARVAALRRRGPGLRGGSHPPAPGSPDPGHRGRRRGDPRRPGGHRPRRSPPLTRSRPTRR